MKNYKWVLAACAAVLCNGALAAGCLLATAPVVTFPAYDVASATPTSTAPLITMNCTGNATQDISIGASSVSGSITNRQMKHATRTDRLNYNLYKDSGYTTVWGTSAAGSSLKVTNPKTNEVQTIYARIPAGQDVAVGSYSDSVTVTLSP